jgi:hypothetical protein
MTGKVRNIYACGNTAKGVYHFYDSVLQGLDRLYILKGGPGTGKSTLMKSVGEEMILRGHDIEWIHCASDNSSIDGVIVTDLKIGIVDGTAPHVIEPKAPGAIEEYVNLGEAWNSKLLSEQKEIIIQLNNKISESFQKAYDTFAEALKIHDEWEHIYIANMDFTEANKLTKELIELFYGEQYLNKQSNTRHMYFGAATPQGAVDHIQNLTKDISKRYFIKGRPGSGKSTMLKKLAAEAEERGFDVEVYHCGFDPNSLDMVLLPEVSVAIFDSTSPHEYFPSREGDEIVDVYERAITTGTDEKYAPQISDIVARYSAKMKEATGFLAEAKSLHDDLEDIYVPAMDFSKLEKVRHLILSEMTRFTQNSSAK